ncbi:Xaa-Pro aminopeptidase [Micromonospora pisi]|uniref:Xaa-Pro aminopeptidase n=1 Tax=Micromonospora pisi TaxID=589240 RepID=A0A495JAR1_9ACTN|nr:Xaa-Pro peptidase family protein [Micromonospora pisi]RKR86106.1 Xaa-Pro aminopeptidase [Micromonospora pisi]
MLETQRLSPTFYQALQDDLRAELARHGLDAMLADDPQDVAYLTGFFHHPGERPVAVLLPLDGTTRLLLPELEHEHASAQRSAAELVAYPEFPGLRPQFSYLAPVTGRIGYAGSMSVDRLAQVTAAFPDATLVRTDLVTRSRFRKRPEEIALHAEAARITDLMLAAGRTLISDAVAAGGELPSESELADHITTVGTRTMYAEHADVVVVSPLAGGLVYAGPNSARPHALPSGYRLRPGDTFMLSLGCAVGGRFVEGERTFILGEPSADQRRYYEAVRQAQQVGGEALRPGVACSAANNRCLDVIRDAGLAEYLRHRQGHGIGLGMHEPPWLADGDDTPLEAGMVVSNEPGIYIPGHAGYRISDSMLITEDGARPFTAYPRCLDDVVIAL